MRGSFFYRFVEEGHRETFNREMRGGVEGYRGGGAGAPGFTIGSVRNKDVIDLVQIAPAQRTPTPKPEWLKARAPVGENFHELKRLARSLNLHTVCESAHCPNIGECWHHKTATFMMLGNLCTRRCGFCAVPKGRPEPIDLDEPRRVAEAVAQLGLEHAVITSVSIVTMI